MTFPDHFSAHAGDYARFRPRYPAALVDFLADRAPGRALAWDCATGNGQAADALRVRFAHVVATDGSGDQLRSAMPLENVGYVTALAEDPPLAVHAVDVVAIAQALHWFEPARFWAAVRRVVRPQGLVAAWSYGRARIDPETDAIVEHYYRDVLGPYWPAETALVEKGYRDVDVPFERLATPEFHMEEDWTADQWLGYLGTWSASRRYLAERGENPLRRIDAALRDTFGGATRRVRWKLAVIAARVA